MIYGLKKEGSAFLREKFPVTIAAADGLGKGIKAAFGAINDGEADVDTGFDQLGGDENDGKAFFSKTLGVCENTHDVPGTHPGGEMECVCLGAEFLVKSLRGFCGIEDEKAAGGGILKDVGNELVVVDSTEIFAFDAVGSSFKRCPIFGKTLHKIATNKNPPALGW